MRRRRKVHFVKGAALLFLSLPKTSCQANHWFSYLLSRQLLAAKRELTLNSSTLGKHQQDQVLPF